MSISLAESFLATDNPPMFGSPLAKNLAVASIALSGDETATLKYRNVGGPFTRMRGERQGEPGATASGTEGMVTWTIQPGDSLSVMHHV